MSSIAERLQRVIEQQETAGAEPIDTLLATMRPEDAELLRACAIPQDFTAETLQVLEPNLTSEKAQKKYARMQRLAVVIQTAEGAAIHDVPRRKLFRQWLVPARGGIFRILNRRLYDEVQSQLSGTAGEPRERLLRQAVFHQLAFDRADALAQFETMADGYRRNLRYIAAETLIGLAREYEPVLDPREKIIINYQEARLAADRGSTEKAIEIFRAIGDGREASPLMTARALFHLGRTLIDLRQWSMAEDELRNALVHLENVPEARERSAIARWLGVVKRETGDIDAAEKLFNESAELAKAIGDHYGVAAAHNALGSAYRESGELRRAIEQFEIAGNFLDARPYDQARVYHNLGTTLMDLRDFARSEEQFRKSLEIKERSGDTVGQAYTWRNLAHLYHADEKLEAAKAAVAKASDLFEAALDWYHAGSAAMYLASLQAKSDREAARLTGARAIRDFELAGDTKAAEKTRVELAQLLDPKRRIRPWIWLLILALFAGGIVVLLLYSLFVTAANSAS